MDKYYKYIDNYIKKMEIIVIIKFNLFKFTH